MTMKDMKCDVCLVGEAIGVASTSQPYSCAYCQECANQGADPEWIFKFLLDEVANGDPKQIKEGLVTYKDGKYITFHQWAELINNRKGVRP